MLSTPPASCDQAVSTLQTTNTYERQND